MQFKDYTKTAHAAARINKEAPAGITVEHKSRHTIKVDFGDKGYLTPEVPALAREYGYVLEAVFGSAADFKPEDHPRVQA